MATDETDQACVLILDKRDLRRAGLVAQITPWAALNGLQVVAAKSADSIDLEHVRDRVRVTIVSNGSGAEPCEHEHEVRSISSEVADAPTVVVSDQEAPEEVMQCVRAGAAAFLPTSASPDFALRVIAFVVEGGSYFPLCCIRDLAESTKINNSVDAGGDDNGNSDPLSSYGHSADRGDDGDDSGKTPLTMREGQVLELLMHGETNKVIAKRLGTTEGTIKIHVRQIMRKLGATNRTQAAMTARRIGNVAHSREERLAMRDPG